MKPYYERDGITIYCEDCLRIMPRLEPPFDAIICDPPYGQTACAWDSVIPLQGMWINYKRLIKDNGAVVLFGSQPFTTDLINSNREWFTDSLVWEKQHPKGFYNARRRPLRSHEDIIIFSQGQTTYNPQGLTSVNIKSSRKNKKGNGVYGKISSDLYIQKEGDFPRSIFKFDTEHNPIHPTQKPLDLMSYLIRTYTNPGELILDNAMGSGTTLVAAQNEGCRCTGIELSEEYCRIAVDRLRQPSFFSIPSNGKVKTGAKQLEIDIK